MSKNLCDFTFRLYVGLFVAEYAISLGKVIVYCSLVKDLIKSLKILTLYV